MGEGRGELNEGGWGRQFEGSKVPEFATSVQRLLSWRVWQADEAGSQPAGPQPWAHLVAKAEFQTAVLHGRTGLPGPLAQVCSQMDAVRRLFRV